MDILIHLAFYETAATSLELRLLINNLMSQSKENSFAAMLINGLTLQVTFRSNK